MLPPEHDFKRWVLLPPMSVPRTNACAVNLDGRLIVLGGHSEDQRHRSVEVYEPLVSVKSDGLTQGEWKRLPDMNFQRAGGCACILHQSQGTGKIDPNTGQEITKKVKKIVVAGGSNKFGRLSTVECWG